MKISPIAGPAHTVGATAGADPQPTAVQKMRSLRMSTNVTPEAAAPPPEAPLTISDTTDPATADAEATQPLSPQFAALAKQRRALQVKERALQDREKALTAQSATPAGAVDLARLKTEPLSVLLEAGVTYEQLTEAILSNQGGNTPELQELKAQIKALEDGLETKLKDRDAQAEQQVLAEIQREAMALTAEGDDFELVRETKSIPDVMDLIKRTYKETGEVLDTREALRLVEDELVQESLKVAGLKKVQSRLAPPPPAPPPPQQQRQMRTLTNRDTATVPMSAKQRALAAFHGTLKR